MIASIKSKCAVQLRAVEINESERVVRSAKKLILEPPH